MCKRHTFRGIGNQITRHQRIFHTDMSHRDSVADRDCRKYHRHAASLRNAKLYRVDNLIQIHVTGNNLVVGAHNTDHRLVHLLLGKSQRVKQTSMRCLLHPFFYIITLHLS